jgi:hypothetical protein
MNKYKIGDKVTLKPANELEYPHWKLQEVGTGVIENIRTTGWIVVIWEDGAKYAYRDQDLRRLNNKNLINAFEKIICLLFLHL